MTPEKFDDATRELAGGSRRAALGALFGAALAAFTADDGEARKLNNARKRGRRRKASKRGKKGGKNKGKGKGKNKNKDKKKKRKNTGGGGGGGGGCTNSYSEQEILGFIRKAARKYGQNASAMERVARCESVLDPCAVNKSGPYYGLFQFLKSTWKTTPYGNESIWDPEAQSNATAWMWKEGRKNEWACK